MKKTLLGFLIVAMALFMAWVIISSAGEKELPPPFPKLKAFAMSCEADPDGDYILGKEITIEESKVRLSIIYLPAREVIGIIRKEDGISIAVAWVGARNAYLVEAYRDGWLLDQKIVEEKDAVDLAYRFFREMVAERLI